MIDTSGTGFEDHLRQTLNAVAATVEEEQAQPITSRPMSVGPKVRRKTPFLAAVAAAVVAMIAVVGITARQDVGPPVPATSGTWTPMATSPLSPRFSPSSVWTGSEMIVFGGHDRSQNPLYDGAAYNPQTNSWRPIAEIPLDDLHEGCPTRCYGRPIQSALVGDTVFAIAASGPDWSWDLVAYDITEDSWQTLDQNRFTQLSSDELIRHGGDAPFNSPIALAAWNGQLVVYGSDQQLGQGWASYDPESQSWGTYKSFPGVAVWARAASIVDDRYMVALDRAATSRRPPGLVIDLEAETGNPLAFPEDLGEDAWLWMESISGGSVVAETNNNDGAERVAYQVDPVAARMIPAKAPPAGPGSETPATLAAISGGYVLIGGFDRGGTSGGLKLRSVALVTDSNMSVWREMPEPAIDINRTGHVAIWTGSQLIVWGGGVAEPGGPVNAATRALNDGAVFTPGQ